MASNFFSNLIPTPTAVPNIAAPTNLLFPFVTNQAGFDSGATLGNPNNPTPASPAATPAGPSVNLQALLASIPIALDGQVIFADIFNSLRAAVIGIANQLGVGLQTTSTAYTFAPTFIPISVANTPPNWSIANFVASHSGAGGADGWLPVQLPNGQRIQGMVVTGTRSGTGPTALQVHLFRKSITAPSSEDPTLLITIPFESTGSPFQVSGSIVATPGTTSALSVLNAVAAEEKKLIDTSQYKYFVRATLLATSTENVEIDSIQIVCGP